METIIAQGAEAIIYKIDNKIVKDRISKKYRYPELDNKIRKSRTKSEAKIMSKLKSIVNVPQILADPGSGKMIHMQFIEGKKLSEHLDSLKNKFEIAEQIGSEVAKIHENNIIHGDLTTSNMIYNEKENKAYFIDFGLGFHSKRIEDKAVDLHLLRQALEAKHFINWKELFEAVLKGYNSKDKELILEQLKKVEARGRYKH
jgi:bifunctional N6-L-threonylcarbamoyladenine synthase / protein kinase Bud32